MYSKYTSPANPQTLFEHRSSYCNDEVMEKSAAAKSLSSIETFFSLSLYIYSVLYTVEYDNHTSLYYQT